MTSLANQDGVLRLGTRASELARTQSALVADLRLRTHRSSRRAGPGPHGR